MQKGVHQLIAIFLLGCLLMTTVGYHLAFRVHLQLLKAEMKRNLRRSPNRKEVLELSFDAGQQQQLGWEDEEEFSWRGEMFDVLHQKEAGGRLYITCIADKKEKQLLEEYRKNTENHSDPAVTGFVKLITTGFLLSSVDLPSTPQKELDPAFPLFPYPLSYRPSAVPAIPPEMG